HRARSCRGTRTLVLPTGSASGAHRLSRSDPRCPRVQPKRIKLNGIWREPPRQINLFEASFELFERLFLRHVEREAQLRNENRASPFEHRLLSRGQATTLIARRQVPYDFHDLVDVAGLHLLLMVLEPAAPVRGFTNIAFADELEQIVDIGFGDRWPHADVIDFVDRNLQHALAVNHLEQEILPFFTTDLELHLLL